MDSIPDPLYFHNMIESWEFIKSSVDDRYSWQQGTNHQVYPDQFLGDFFNRLMETTWGLKRALESVKKIMFLSFKQNYGVG